MSPNRKVVEIHGCIVCGKLYNLLVIYAPDGRMVDCTVTSPNGRLVTDAERLLVACNEHTKSQVEQALTRLEANEESDEED